jgi:GNAT superfamily N-acetyltransferase
MTSKLAGTASPPRHQPDSSADFRDRVRMFGLPRVLLSLALRKLERSLGFHVWVFGIRPLSSNWTPPADHAATYSFRVLDLQEGLRAAEDPGLSLSKDFVVKAARRGDICCAAFVGARLVGYTWLSLFEADGPHGIRLRLTDDRVAYGYKTFVHADYRGRRLNGSLVGFAEAELVRRGIEHLVGYVALGNLPSMKAYFGAGASRRIGHVLLIDWPAVFLPLSPKAVRRVITLERAGFERIAKSAG